MGKIYKRITVEDLKNIEDTWEVNEPMYYTIDIYGSYEQYLNSSKSFTLEQRYLFAITWYLLEVDNGGHDQFFFNSTGIVWKDALDGFRLFGMHEYANNFQQLVDYLGEIPFDRFERGRYIEEKIQDEEEYEKLLKKVNRFVYNYEGADNESEYVRNHPEKFVFDGYYDEIE